MDDQPQQPAAPVRARVWAEARGLSEALLTWQRDASTSENADAAADARAVAATIGVMQGVSSATVTEDGVLVRYDPETVSRSQLASAVRSALSLDADLKTRANELMKRTPSYLGLARSLALDERVSPVPEAARQATTSRGTPLPAATALPIAGRFVPGLPLLTRLHTLVPVLRTLTSWSREASPEVVSEHLERAGLSRDQLDRDLATAQEAVAFARDYASETAGKAISAASTAAIQARLKAREWARQYNERTRTQDPEP